MVITVRYSVTYDEVTGEYWIKSFQIHACPTCGSELSGYDRRMRKIIWQDGTVRYFRIRRLRCSRCKSIHVELPSFIVPNKQYTADVIADVQAGRAEACPADDSTIRRWKK